MGLSAEDILRVWEDGRDQRPADRALTMLAAGLPEVPWEDLCRLPIGRRDAALLELRARTFGERITLLARCPACTAQAELALDIPSLILPPVAAVHELSVDLDGGGAVRIRYRLPDSRDLAAVPVLDEAEAARELQGRCVLAIEGPGVADGEGAIRVLSPAIAARLDEHMAAADPQAEVQLEMSCPVCTGAWTELFEIGEVFFTEIEREGRRILGEVDTLARAYGWREADILAMSAARRASYLELVG